MENTKSEKNDNFKAKVHRILYESNTSSSDDDSLTFAELPEQRRQVTDELELSAVELLHRHEEFITKQRNAVIKMQQKGILTVSSKYRVDGLVENGVLAEEQPSGENSNSKGRDYGSDLQQLVNKR